MWRTVLLLCFVITTGAAECETGCPNIPTEIVWSNFRDNCVWSSGPVNSSSTAVVLTFNLRESCFNYYTVRYRKSTESSSEDVYVCVNGGSVILTSLVPNTQYNVSICTKSNNDNGSVCCSANFNTPVIVQNLSNQVQGVRAHTFFPSLNSVNNVSAQIVWKALNMTVEPEFYDVRIRTADMSFSNVMGAQFFNLPPQDTFVNVLGDNTDLYPLEKGKRYIVQVRGKNKTASYSWSEPVLIDTVDISPETDFLLLDEEGLKVFDFDGQLVVPARSDVNQPVAIDKRNRNIFYHNTRTIYKSNIDIPFNEMEFYTFMEEYNVISMTYDWIAQKLYVGLVTAANEANEQAYQFKLCYLLDVPLRQRELNCLTMTDEIEKGFEIATTFNPILGIIYWTQKADDDSFQLNIFNLIDNSRTLNNISLNSLAIAEDIQNGCIYVVTEEKVKCKKYNHTDTFTQEIEISHNDDINAPKFIAVKEDGVYIATTSAVIKYYSNDDHDNHKEILALNNSLQWFDITNPGSQPLPEQACLTPIITESKSQVSIKERTATSFYIEWDIPNLSYHEDCQTQPFSRPPLFYEISLAAAGKQQILITQYETSVNVTDINTSLMYTVILSVITSFSTLNEPILIGTTMIDNSSIAMSPATSAASTTTGTSITSTISSTSMTSSTSGTDNNTRMINTSATRTTVSITTSVITVMANVTGSIAGSASRTDITSSTVGTDTATSTVDTYTATSTVGTYTETITVTTASITGATPTLLPPPRNSNTNANTAIIAGISGGVVIIIVLIVGVVIVITAIICVRSSRKSYTTNQNSARYVRREGSYESQPYATDLPANGGSSNGNLLASYVESPLTLSNHPLLNSSTTLSTQAQENGLQAPYAIPADSLEQYRSSQLVEQAYEVPVSQKNTLSSSINSGNTNSENKPPPVYSTLDDAIIDKKHFNSKHVGDAIPPNYTSLYPPNMEEPHSYSALHSSSSPIPIDSEIYSEPIVSPIRSGSKGSPLMGGVMKNLGVPSSPITMDSEIYSEPIASPIRSGSKGSPPVGGVKRSSKDGIIFDSKKNLGVPSSPITMDLEIYSEPIASPIRSGSKGSPLMGGVKRSSKDGIIFDSKKNPGKAAFDNPVYEIEPSVTNGGVDNHTYSSLDTSNNLPQSNSRSCPGSTQEPAYFELERLKVSETNSSDSEEPTYFELERSSSGTVINPRPHSQPQAHSDDSVSDPEPTYSEVKPAKNKQNDPLYFQLEHNHHDTKDSSNGDIGSL